MKRISTIAYAPPETGRTNTGGKDAFIFSSNIDDWIRSTKVKHAEKQREYDRAKPKGTGRISRADHRKPEDL